MQTQFSNRVAQAQVSSNAREPGYVPLVAFLAPKVRDVKALEQTMILNGGTKKKVRTNEVKARSFMKSLGGRVAGGFLRNRGYTLEQTLEILGMPHRFGK